MRKKFLFRVAILCVSIFFLLHFASAEEKKIFQIKKQPEIQQVRPRKPVKIRLKRSAEGKYTWDLTGDDVDQIVKADKRLKKLLNIE
jgi:hypothetical protein